MKNELVDKDDLLAKAINISKVIANYRVTIPKEVRNDLDLEIGDKVLWTRVSSDTVLLEKMPQDYEDGE